jgi:hypothetical protein
MSSESLISCSLCGSVSLATINSVPDNGLTLEPYTWGGYGEFCDSLAWLEILDKLDDEQYQAECRASKRHLCHDCCVKLFQFLKIEPEPAHHPFALQGVRCCDWGYDY